MASGFVGDVWPAVLPPLPPLLLFLTENKPKTYNENTPFIHIIAKDSFHK